MVIFNSADEVIESGMTMYKFVLPHNVFTHPQTDPGLNECSNSKLTNLHSGLSDVSPCYYGTYICIYNSSSTL